MAPSNPTFLAFLGPHIARSSHGQGPAGVLILYLKGTTVENKKLKSLLLYPLSYEGFGLLRGFRTVVSVDFLCCEDVLLVSVVDVVGPLVAKR